MEENQSYFVSMNKLVDHLVLLCIDYWVRRAKDNMDFEEWVYLEYDIVRTDHLLLETNGYLEIDL